MNKNYWMRIGLTSIVTAGVFRISAGHIITVAERAGNSFSEAVVYPVSIDAVIVISALTLVARTGVNRMAKWYASLGRAFGFAATIFANVSAGGYASLATCVTNLVPALALILVMELLVHSAQATPATRARSRSRRKTPKQSTTRRSPLHSVA